MDNVVILTSSDSDSDFSDDSGGHSDREEIIYESEYFMNHVNKKEYEKNRNKLFTKDIEEVNIIVENIDNTDKNNYTYNFQSNSSNVGGGLGEFKNVIGITLLRSCLISSSNTNPHFVDIIIPEIPYKVCIHNSNRYNLIARLCIEKNASNQMIEYEPENIKDNYFYPITLSKFTIKICDAGTMNTYNGLGNSFLFRLTILKNLDLLQ